MNNLVLGVNEARWRQSNERVRLHTIGWLPAISTPPPTHRRPLRDLQRTSAPLSSLTAVSAAGGEGGAEAQDESL